ncbi:hypothetical protein [Pseudomonas gingeri]|uniref:hypothetical protein n=1 Tax=Pseudomonas gingeri TaxID=117681 RepID=UPI0015A2F9C1|nr:hypothetical protein [Pseudomonas gingeri]NWD06521.1 hypothetical protein [Pseudomonas gingeri]NWD48826.1 hypothetical protein [Pseudomonas gingeri]NWE33199.1 hypothetical protein [Pseudomonas gingeri]NWE55464.1 hypothetical protein [Pseudomonas gingeri]NWF04047.1 hypothetical protein [Pseudomonas gingeri]
MLGNRQVQAELLNALEMIELDRKQRGEALRGTRKELEIGPDTIEACIGIPGTQPGKTLIEMLVTGQNHEAFGDLEPRHRETLFPRKRQDRNESAAQQVPDAAKLQSGKVENIQIPGMSQRIILHELLKGAVDQRSHVAMKLRPSWRTQLFPIEFEVLKGKLPAITASDQRACGKVDIEVFGEIIVDTGVEQQVMFLGRIVAPKSKALLFVATQLLLVGQRRTPALDREKIRALRHTTRANRIDVLPGMTQPGVIQVSRNLVLAGRGVGRRTKLIRFGPPCSLAKRTFTVKQPLQAKQDRGFVEVVETVGQSGLRAPFRVGEKKLPELTPRRGKIRALKNFRHRHKAAVKSLHDSSP